MAWNKFLLSGDVELIDPLVLAGTVTIVAAGKHLEVGNLHFETAGGLTIATGSVTPTLVHHTLAGEGAAADDLDKIVAGVDGELLLIRRLEGAGYSVTIRHNQSAGVSDNILLANGDNYVMDGDVRMLLLMYDSTVDTNGAWQEVSRGLGAAALLASAAPPAVDGSAAAVGTGTTAARDDHVHALGPLVANLDASQQQIVGHVLHATPTAPDAASEVEGQIYFDTTGGDKHPYVWIP